MKLLILSSLLALVSCGKGGSGGSGSSPVGPLVVSGSIYRVPVAIQRTSTIGLSYDYECDGNECQISGEIIQFYQSAANLVYMPVSGTIAKVADGYYGQIEFNQPPYVGSFGLYLNEDFTFKSLDNGAKCVNASAQSSEQDYQDFKQDFQPNNLDLYEIDLSGYQAKSNCGL